MSDSQPNWTKLRYHDDVGNFNQKYIEKSTELEISRQKGSEADVKKQKNSATSASRANL